MKPRSRRNRKKEEERLGPVTRKIGTLQHFRWLRGIVISILVFNVLDAVLTIAVVATGRASEANPFMADMVEREPAAFFIVKLTMVSLGSFMLWQLRKRPFAVFGIFVAFLAYYGVLLYHLSAMDIRLFDRLAAYFGS